MLTAPRLWTSIVSLAALMVLGGCTTAIHIRPDLEFGPREQTVPLDVDLYVSPEAENDIIRGVHMTYKAEIRVGEALKPNGRRSLGKVFRSVTLADSPGLESASGAGGKRLVSLSATQPRAVKLGFFTFSKHSVDLTLHCEVSHGADAPYWETDVQATAAKRSWWGLLGGLIGDYAYFRALHRASDESLRQVLEGLNDRLIADRERILEGG